MSMMTQKQFARSKKKYTKTTGRTAGHDKDSELTER